jgi:outer membrane protein OmpA-like peptidoglycan-associated protein
MRSRPSFARWPVGLLLATSALASPARAADECVPSSGLSTCIDADNLWPHAGAGPWLSIGSADTTRPGQASFGLVASYLSRPVGVRVSSADPEGTVIYAVDNVFDASFLFAVGVTDRLEATLATPVTLWQDGAALSDVLGTDEALVRSTVRHVRPGLTYRLLARPREGLPAGPALTGRFELAIPAGGEGAFARAETVVAAPSLAYDHVLGELRLGAELGARLRGESELAGAHVGSQLGLALGASYDVLPAHLLLASAEVFGLYTFAGQDPPLDERDQFTDGPPLVPAEWILSATTAPLYGGDLAFTVGGGGPLPLADASAITAPRFRFDVGVRYAPLGLDQDGDGVPDRDDLCPNEREDRDGFEDADGCPDPDNDRDRILDAVDRCRDAAETVDGFEDQDGCPDLDDDGDGIPDEQDRCRNEPEDRDGFEDDDGCPDLDNDADGISDAVDKCPGGAEDRDGFKDDDGCPDPDNDLDQIPDDRDLCPDAAEDRDGFEDDDGCPDPDNDRDGVLDAADKCPTEAETIDGRVDDDGCPEPGARSLVAWSGDHVAFTRPIAFARGSAALSKDAEAQVKLAAVLLQSRAPLELVLVDGYADRTGDASEAAIVLAAQRAAAVKRVLVASGLPSDRITAAAGDLTTKRPAGAPAVDIAATQEKPKKRN